MVGRKICVWLCCALSAVGVGAGAAMAQVGAPEQYHVARDVASGWVTNNSDARAAIYQVLIHEPGASSIRLEFAEVQLGARPAGAEPTVIRVSSLLDGAAQHLNAVHVGQWGETSAYFNGDAVLVEIVADPGAKPSRLKVIGAWCGAPVDGDITQTLCGNDNRALSDVPGVGRSMPIGCTAWMIDDANHCFLTAGHCATASMQVMQFNVPLSSSGGAYLNPGPEDQYVIDQSSLQTQSGSPSLGDDWAYFGCFANTETGLTPFQTQLAFYVLNHAPPSPVSQSIDITGYGTTTFPIPNTWNGVQKIHVGPYTVLSGTTLRYQVDTTGGNSGSPVLNLDSGMAIGIHTNGGCDDGTGSNIGCGLNNASLQSALANPQGVCVPAQPLVFVFVDGTPEAINPAGEMLTLVVAGQGVDVPEPGTGILHIDRGSGFVDYPMSEQSPNVYSAAFPASVCGDTIRFYVSAEEAGGQRFFSPAEAPLSFFEATSTLELVDLFGDDFETDTGWTVTNAGGLTDGAWDRGVPAGGGDRGDPPADADGSGQCYLTDNVDGNSDVDAGSTILTSPQLDATDPDAWLLYDRWFDNASGSAPEEDEFVVEVSDDNGASWLPLEVVGPDGDEVHGGWFHLQWRLADVPDLTATDEFRVRFTANDLLLGSVVEAGVDGVSITRIVCDDCPAEDIDGDCMVGFADLLIVLGDWGDCPVGPPCPADLNEDGLVGFSDLVQVLGAWGV